jgi:hypothetical protein
MKSIPVEDLEEALERQQFLLSIARFRQAQTALAIAAVRFFHAQKWVRHDGN